MADNQKKMFGSRPQGEDPFPSLPDRGVSTGVTDTYGADLEKGFNRLSPGTRSQEMGSVNNGC